MSGLFSLLHVARDAMQAQQLALEVTKNNIANVNTPGYSRQRALLIENPPARSGSLVFGRGATVGEVGVFRDRFIEIRLAQENQTLGFLSERDRWLAQVEASVNESSGSGIQDALSRFFGSLLQLTSDPGNTTLRQDVLAQAGRLTAVLNQRSQALQNLEIQVNQQMASIAGEVNRLSQQIQRLNDQIIPTESGGVDSGALRDQRQLALQELAELVDISYYETESGSVVVSTGTGRALVTGTRSKSVAVTKDGAGKTALLLDGTDITGEFTGGRMGATVDLRTSVFDRLHTELDALADDLLTRINAVHAGGRDLQVPPQLGGAFFSLAPNTVGGGHAAARIGVAITDPKLIAASQSGNPDDNLNARALFAVGNEVRAPLGNLTFGEYTASIATFVANKTNENTASLAAEESVMAQLRRQRESISGVSLDEEALDLVRYQRAFEASSRFFATINHLADELLQLLG